MKPRVDEPFFGFRFSAARNHCRDQGNLAVVVSTGIKRLKSLCRCRDVSPRQEKVSNPGKNRVICHSGLPRKEPGHMSLRVTPERIASPLQNLLPRAVSFAWSFAHSMVHSITDGNAHRWESFTLSLATLLLGSIPFVGALSLNQFTTPKSRNTVLLHATTQQP